MAPCKHTAALDMSSSASAAASMIGCGCSSFLGLLGRTCLEGLLPRAARQPVEIAPTLRERVCARSTNMRSDAVDIHTLLVSPDPGRSLNRTYKSLALLGRGGFGSVYRVQYTPTGEERAIKVIPKPRDAAGAEQVLAEVQALVTLDHPNVEKFFELFEDGRAVCLV